MNFLRRLSRRRGFRPDRSNGLTLIELMVVVAVIGVIALMAAPSIRNLLEMQRLKGVSAQFLTDVQFARSEAASRQELTGLSFPIGAASGTCYIVHSCGTATPDNCSCDCTAAAGARCSAPRREIKTVKMGLAAGVKLSPTTVPGSVMTANRFSFDPATGRIGKSYRDSAFGLGDLGIVEFWASAQLTRPGATADLQTKVALTGRPANCSAGTPVTGIPSC